MLFYTSKIVGPFLLPSNSIVVLIVVGIALLTTSYRKIGLRVLTIGLALLFAVGFSPLGNALMTKLEDRFPPWDTVRGPPKGIVILGGALGPELRRNAFELNDAAERLTAAVILARLYPEARVIYSGGVGTLARSDRTEAGTAMELLEQLGLQRERMLAETRSRNTYENAIYSKTAANPRSGDRWILITSANHMPRAVGSFRRVGFNVEAYPVDWRTQSSADAFKPFANIGSGLRQTDVATYEWIALFFYWVTGKSIALFPSPDS